MYTNLRRIEDILRCTSLLIFAIFLSGLAFAQVKFSTVINDKQPEISGYVQVEYTVENAQSIRGIAPPSFRNFRVIQGPVQSTGMSYMNGVLSHSKSVSLILQPLAIGKLLVPGATAFIDGKMMRSEGVLIEVRNVGSRGNSAPQSVAPLWPETERRVDEEYVLRPGESVVEKIKDNLLVKAVVNKTTCYLGEPITATFTLCSRLNSESRVLKRPSLNGFSVYDMVEPETNSPTVESINGKNYNVHTIRKTQLFPLQQGTFVIDPVELDNKVRFLKKGAEETSPRNRIERLLDEFLNEEKRKEVEHHFTLASKPVTITVKPLPSVNVPPGFNGAVGKFVMEVQSGNEPVEAGSAIRLRLTIKGEGNFSMINPPVLSLPPRMEGYEPIVNEKVDKTIYPLNGTKTFEYTVVAKDTGFYRIPSIIFSYFDPSSAQYKTERSDTLGFRVIPASKVKGTRPEETKTIENPVSWKWIHDVPGAAIFLSMAILFFAWLGIYEGRRKRRRKRMKRERLQSIPVKPLAPEPPAVQIPSAPLEAAKAALKEERSSEFYTELNKAVWKTLYEKLSIPSAELNKYNAALVLKTRGASDEIINTLNTVLHECEMALYTPGHTTADMQQTLEKAETVINYLKTSLT